MFTMVCGSLFLPQHPLPMTLRRPDQPYESVASILRHCDEPSPPPNRMHAASTAHPPSLSSNKQLTIWSPSPQSANGSFQQPRTNIRQNHSHSAQYYRSSRPPRSLSLHCVVQSSAPSMELLWPIRLLGQLPSPSWYAPSQCDLN